jgi:redox-sensitive bicupin YhaK (pirin superfamily)
MNKAIREIVRDVPQHWVGDGFPVRSLFSYSDGNRFDPFLLLDYGGPHRFEPSSAKRGVGEHPHRGFETVTIVYQGEVEHRDSSGSHGTIGPGDVQWMTAASGVVHEEFHSERFTHEGGVFEMVQLWVNLPAADKMTAPRYQGITDAQIPRVALPDDRGTVRVIAGDFAGTHGAAKTFSPVNVWDVQLSEAAVIEVPVPPGHLSLLIVQQGAVVVNDTPVKAVELAAFVDEGDRFPVEASSDARLLILTGEPLREPVAGRGPFVMNTPEQIREAILDFQSGKMGRLS